MMKTPWKLAGIILAGGIVAIQFFQPERNLGAAHSEHDLAVVLEAPEKVASILENSCYDCHSNRTAYPWYSRVSPFSWYLGMHIRKGKEELNLNEFGTLDKNKRIGTLADICDVIETGEMPLKSYLLIHRESVLSENDREEICNWLESEALKMMKQ